MSNKQKFSTICIIGKPNAGKSTLLNQLIGQKISIVTHKVQTTRSIITGICSQGDAQLIFFDTPGIFEPKKKLEKAMVRAAWSSLSGADQVTLIIDANKIIDEVTQSIIKRLNSQNIQMICLLNKVDKKSKFFEQNREDIKQLCPQATFFTISALTGEGVDEYKQYLVQRSLPSTWHYSEDDITNLPIRFLAAEITREHIFMNLHQEIPYNLTVESESWEEKKDGSVKVNQVVIVSRETYKQILLGKGGSMIKKIGAESRLDIAELAGCKIHLFLFVKVRKNWDDNII